MAEGAKKLFIMVTNGPENPEPTIPFVMATAALASDVKVVMVMRFQGNGSMLAMRCMADHVFARVSRG